MEGTGDGVRNSIELMSSEWNKSPTLYFMIIFRVILILTSFEYSSL